VIFGTLSRLLGSGRVDWRKGQIDAYYHEQEWQVKRGLAAELAKMKACRKAIDELKREAAEIISAAPWAKGLVATLLEQRLSALRAVASGEVRTSGSGLARET